MSVNNRMAHAFHLEYKMQCYKTVRLYIRYTLRCTHTEHVQGFHKTNGWLYVGRITYLLDLV